MSPEDLARGLDRLRESVDRLNENVSRLADELARMNAGQGAGDQPKQARPIERVGEVLGPHVARELWDWLKPKPPEEPR